MKPNKINLLLSAIITLCSIYCLSFSFIDYRLEKKATEQATNGYGKVDFDQKQAYLEELWHKPVYRLFGLTYTYEQVKERSLKLGLDLKGGMHVTLDLVPIDLVKKMAAGSSDPTFLDALFTAQQDKEKGSQISFGHLFVSAYRRLSPEGSLINLFLTTDNKARSYIFANDGDVIHAIDTEIQKALTRSLTIVRARLDRFGTFQPNIQQLPGSGRIQIDLPGVTHPQRVRKLLQGVAQLQFYAIADSSLYAKQLEAVDALLLKEEVAQLSASLPEDMPEEEKNSRFPKQSILARSSAYPFPYALAYSPEVIEQIKAIFSRKDVRAILPKQLTWMWEKKVHTTQDKKQLLIIHPIQLTRDQKPLLEGGVITNATQSFDEQGGPVVDMQMNRLGSVMWKRITGSHIGRRIAIVLDGQVCSAPTVNVEIENGRSQISGHFSVEEAKDLANILQTGALPAPLKILEEAIVGPSLGKEAQHSGLMATAMGLGLVLFFMLLYYGKGGAIANFALCLNLFFIIAVLAQLDATLTLPGIAGLVLTIGMSVDADVLIFERIREELRNKVHLKEAIKRGYARSYSSIIDSNITTFLAGVVLYYFGQGQVRGFATVLIIGIFSSIFSSIFVTKWCFSFFISRRKNPNFTFALKTVVPSFKPIHFSFIKKRVYFYAFSLLFLISGAVACYMQRGLSFGVDFLGGRSYVVEFNQPVDASALKTHFASKLSSGLQIRTYGASHVLQITTSYLVQNSDEATDREVLKKLTKQLEQFVKTSQKRGGSSQDEQPLFKVVSSSKVGASMAKDVQKSAQIAIVLALVGIYLYIALRFKQQSFGLAAVSALIHDGLSVLAGFSLARMFGITYEIDEVFLAALLTVIGYSINDTVVIFDRIREKLGGKKAEDSSISMLVDYSIGSTLSRTLITSVTTLFTVLMLFCFGGVALRGFAFALLLGIMFGTYSSICIAAPLLFDLSSKKKMV